MHVMAMVAVVMSAGPVEPKAGTYIFEGGAGELVLGEGRFEINVVGANAHVCQVASRPGFGCRGTRAVLTANKGTDVRR